MVVTGTYNPYLVALSALVASFASYTALDLGGHVGPARGFSRRMWLLAAAITMGGGIWSMHFVAMLAFIMPTPMSFDIELTTLSLVVTIFVTGGGFYVISRQSASPLRLVLSGIFMGLGIAAMHYTGMAAMRGHAEISYDPLFVALSLVIAIGASTVALWLAFRTTDLGHKLVAAIVMGLAISGMHYTAMRAAIFTANGPVHEAQVNASLDQTNLALAVAGITFIILACASVASLFERKRAEETLRQAQTDLAHVTRVTTLGELTASIAHEVNQPLAAVVTNAEAFKSPHWRRWLGIENRCLVPWTSFSENEVLPDGSRPTVWFAFDEARPLAFFAGIWTRWTPVRKVKEGETTNDIFAFLTTEPNKEVRTIHPKAMPVVLRAREEIDVWMSAPAEEALKLQRPPPDNSLKVVAKGDKKDEGGLAA
jgi:NO-binding membrane sensor protein with MHYT domain/putative SOS response-associated peptidase YedK